MTGIAGLVHLDGRQADPRDLEAMLARLAHRGPRQDTWSDGDAALGCRGAQAPPAAADEPGWIIVADARLDDRTSLLTSLGLPPAARDAPDATLIGHAYGHWGPRCVEHLTGDFAFALWDRRRRRLLCARDRMGVKPFYFHHRPHGLLAFASEIKALLALEAVPRRINEQRIADYLLPLFENRTSTFYEAIVRLPPAHLLTVDREGLRLEAYWSLDATLEHPPASDAACAAAVRDAFTCAVRDRLRGDGVVGATLSGGLDSSAVVCVARQLRAQGGGARLHTFSIAFPGDAKADEHVYVDAVLAGGGLQPTVIDGPRLSPLDDLERTLDQQDEPFYAPNLFLHAALYRAAREHGVTVLLDGLDGDTTISHGVGALAELAAGGHVVRLAREVSALARRHDRPAWRLVLDHVIRPLLPWELRLPSGRRRQRAPSGAGLLREEVARRLGVEERVAAFAARRRRLMRTARGQHYFALTWGLVPWALEVTDRAAAAFGVEPRYPFFDHRLVELCLALPWDQKLHDGWTRIVFRRAMEGILPPAVQWRVGKADLSRTFLRGLLGTDTGLAEQCFAPGSRVGDYVDLAQVRAAYARGLQRPNDTDALTVWKVLTLERWLARAAAPNSPPFPALHPQPEGISHEARLSAVR